MNDREFLADLLKAILDGEDDELILAILTRLDGDGLQALALAGNNLAHLCRMAFEALPDEEVAG
jgi:hypothetical protein